MSFITTILRAIGIVVVPSVILNSTIERGDITLNSKINNECLLKSTLSTDYDSGSELL